MTIFHLPDLGEGLAEAEIRQWHVKIGEVVSVDQPLVSVETAKAVVDVPSPQAGRIVKLFGSEGETISTHAPLVEFEGAEDVSLVGKLEKSTQLLNEDNVIVGATPRDKSTAIKVMPAVRALANQLKVDLSSIIPTGAQGQITAEDVKKLAENKGTSLHGTRHFMALAMEKSRDEVVPVTVVDDADVTHWPEHCDITVKLIQAMAAAIKQEPLLNAWYDSKNQQYNIQNEIHLGLAIDTGKGLFVPVLRNVVNKSAHELREEIDKLKKAAEERSMKPEDFRGATITLSNAGIIAGRYSTPIILPPTVSILASGKMREVAAVYKGNIAVRRIVPLSLTFDHRVVTGIEATRFLAAVMQHLAEN